MAVCDSFDAMTTDRPYRRALSVPTALAELDRVAGTRLDIGYVRAAIKRASVIGAGEPTRVYLCLQRDEHLQGSGRLADSLSGPARRRRTVPAAGPGLA